MRTLQLLLIVALGVTVSAQTPPTFEVASVKPNSSGTLGSQLRPLPGGRLVARNTPLSNLIRVSFGLQNFQMVGGPAWIDTARYDIDAKAPEDATVPALMAMLRSLLMERFGLAAHKEFREGPIYLLVRARPNGSLGPKLIPSKRPCEEIDRTNPPTRPPNGDLDCGIRTDPGTMTARSVTIAQLVAAISTLANRLVRDETGLTGAFNAEVTWAPDSVTNTTGVPLFTAIQEQLGLKLTPATGPVEVLVIDDVRRLVPD